VSDPIRRKRRTREHVIADLSVNHVERQVFICGYTVERVTRDYGIDLEMTTYGPEGEVEPGLVLFQVKATDHLPLLADGSAVAFPVSTADLAYWLGQISPVVLAVYDAVGDRTFWLYVQRYAEEQLLRPDDLGGSVTLRIPTTNELNPASVRLLREFKARIQAQAGGTVRHAGP
jgi:hypothetical protein